MVRFLRAALLALLPTAIARVPANLMGYRLDRGTRIGFSWVTIEHLTMKPGSAIGHFNVLSGPASALLKEGAGVGRFNIIRCPPRGIVVGAPELTIGEGAKITFGHLVDLAASVTIGDFSTIAGAGSQLWTHAYIHDEEGPGRYRIDGPIVIEANVSVGTMTVITAGVRIARGATIGAGSVVAKDLLEPGLYVASPLRHFPLPADPATRADLDAVTPHLCVDRVFQKRMS